MTIANHAWTRTTQPYDRRSDAVSLDEVERILIERPRLHLSFVSQRRQAEASHLSYRM